MEFTGERVVPDDQDHRHLYFEHMARYAVSQAFIAGKRVLDIGCGTGYGSAYLATCGAEAVVGVDLSEESVDYARANFHLDNLSYVVSDATQLPFEDGQFDVCVSFEVIEHIADDVAYLEQIKRVLSHSGRLVLSTPNKQKSSPDTDIPPNPFHVREYTYDALYRRLSTVFPCVQIVGQHYAEGFRFVTMEQTNPSQVQSLYILQGILPYLQKTDKYNAGGKEEERDEPDYFLTICTLQPVEQLGVVSVTMAGMDTIRRELEARNQWVTILQDEKKVRDQRIADLERTLAEREQWIAIIRAEQEAERTRIADLENTLQDRENWIKQLQSENEIAISRVYEVEKIVQERENWIQILIGEKEARDRRISDLEQTLYDRNMWLKDLEQTVHDRDNRISDLVQTLHDRDGRISDLEQTLHDCEYRIESLTNDADQMQQFAEGLRSNLESLTALLNDRELQLSLMEKQLSDIILQLGERDRKISEYEEKLVNRVLRALKRGGS